MRRSAVVAIAAATGLLGYMIGRSAADAPSPSRAPTAVVASTVDSVRSQAPAVREPTAEALREVANPPAPAATRTASGNASPARTPDTGGRRRVMLGTLDLTSVGYDRGDPKAPIVMIDFSDFGCPYCASFHKDVFPAIDREYIQAGKVYLKYVPFLAGFARGREATRAAECAADQGKFWEMTAAVYETQSAWQKAGDPHAELRTVAAGAALDTAAYWSCYKVNRPDGRTRLATKAADQVAVRVTPSFVVNGRPVEGALPLAEFRKLLDMTLLIEAAKQ